MVQIISKQQAISQGLVSYFTGQPCKNGHIEPRYTNTGICYGCKRQRNKVHRERYPEVIQSISKRTYNKYRDKHLSYSKAWSEKNRERSNQIKKNYKIRHREKYLKAESDRQKEKRKDPFWRLCKNMSKAIWANLKGQKGYRHWETLVGYTFEELKAHLEVQFRDGMTWENYGEYWHVDHKKPLSKCSTFEEAWNLQNLQPLTVTENLKKGNKYEEN